MFNNPTQRLVNLPRPLPKPEADLPRGECRFIQRERDAQTGSRQRCICQGFSLDKQQLVGTACECGHPAWAHVQQPMAAVTYEEHTALAEEVRRFKQEQDTRLKSLQNELVKTQHELLAQRALYSERERLFKAIEARMYQNMKAMKIQLDDKMDGMIDQQHAFQRKLIDVEDATMEHEIHFEKLGIPDKEDPSPRSPAVTAPAVVSATQSAVKVDGHAMHSSRSETRLQPWSARVIMVPHRAQRFAFESSSKASKRCISRNLHQSVSFPNSDQVSFIAHIDSAFAHVLKGRPWIPLVGTHPPEDPLARMALRPLPADLADPALWDLAFLHRHCITHDRALGGAVLFVALRDADMSWDEIRALPPSQNTTTSAEEKSLWTHDVELDAPLLLPPLPGPLNQHQHQHHRRIEADFMDAAAPPPYAHAFAQRQSGVGATKLSVADRLHTPLDVLAASAAVLAPLAKLPTPPPPPPPMAPLTPAPTVSSVRRSSCGSSGITTAAATATTAAVDDDDDDDDTDDSEHSHRSKIRKRSPPSLSLPLPPPEAPRPRRGLHASLGRKRVVPTTTTSITGTTNTSAIATSGIGSGNGSAGSVMEPVYCSGRSKRKMPVRPAGKQREPLPMPSFRLSGLLGGGHG